MVSEQSTINVHQNMITNSYLLDKFTNLELSLLNNDTRDITFTDTVSYSGSLAFTDDNDSNYFSMSEIKTNSRRLSGRAGASITQLNNIRDHITATIITEGLQLTLKNDIDIGQMDTLNEVATYLTALLKPIKFQYLEGRVQHSITLPIQSYTIICKKSIIQQEYETSTLQIPKLYTQINLPIGTVKKLEIYQLESLPYPDFTLTYDIEIETAKQIHDIPFSAFITDDGRITAKYLQLNQAPKDSKITLLSFINESGDLQNLILDTDNCTLSIKTENKS